MSEFQVVLQSYSNKKHGTGTNTQIKTTRYDNYIDQWHIIRDPDINPHNCGHPIFYLKARIT